MSDFYNNEENYDAPETSNYMSFEEGDNKFRILGSFSERTAIQGMLYWKTIEGKRKPVRYAKNDDGTYPTVAMSELEVNKFGELDTPRYFWALPVWNYQAKKVQILEIKQKTIINAIKAYIGNKKWGNPKDYDIIVTRGKEGEKTVYTVTVDPKEPVEESIIDAYVAINIKIQALFKGEDPFAGEDNSSLADEVNRGLNATGVNA